MNNLSLHKIIVGIAATACLVFGGGGESNVAEAQVVVHNNEEIAAYLASLYYDPPSTPVSIVGDGNFYLDNSTSNALESYFSMFPGSASLSKGAIDVAGNTSLYMPYCDFGATGGRITFGELGIPGAVDITLNSFNVGSGAQFRVSGNSGTTHTITANSINIANPNSIYFEGVSVDNAASLRLNGTLNGSPLRSNNLIAVTGIGNTYTANPLAGIDLGTVAEDRGYTGDQLLYYQQLEDARQTIITNGDYTNPAIRALDEIFNGGLQAASFYSAPSAPTNTLAALTVTNNVGAIVFWRQSNEFGDPQSLVASALVRGQSPCSPCGKAGKSRSYDIWFQAFNANMDVWSRGRGGANYSVTRNGGVVGINTSLGKRTAGGLVFGLSNPFFWDEREKLDLVDFQFGGHIETQLGNDWEAGAYIGGGVQNGDSNRRYMFYDGMYSYKADYNGNTFSATVMLSKVYRISKRSALRPTFAIDTEHAWYYSFTERSDQERVTIDPNASRRHYGKNHYGRTLARLGVMAQTGGGKWGLNGRVFYSPQLGGKDYATSTLSLADGQHQGSVYRMDALPLGRDMVALGVGGHLFLNKKRTLLIYGDYNANLFKYATTQVASLGLQKTF